jgi:hypothetical protein
MKQDRIEFKQSKFTYSFKEAQELAEKWAREYNQYFTCLDKKMKYSLCTGTWIVTNKFDPRVIR